MRGNNPNRSLALYNTMAAEANAKVLDAKQQATPASHGEQTAAKGPVRLPVTYTALELQLASEKSVI